jgi:hypothetical protein
MRLIKMRHGLILLLLASLLIACGRLERIKQVRTVADMQTIVAKIEALRERAPSAISDTAQTRSLISSVAGGRDAWGNELLCFTKATATGVSYVLVSMGSDGKSDVADPQDYFTMPERTIHDEPWRDIVFRDGLTITRAGK